MKKIILFILLLFIPFITINASADNSSQEIILEDVKAACLMEINTKQVLYGYNEHVKREPASMTKIMTIDLVLDAIERKQFSFEDIITVSDYAASMGGSQIFLKPNEQMSVENLFKSMVIASANDAAVALGEKVSGTEENFAKMMTQKAKSLGCKDTMFQNATGLPTKNHFTTCYDMALIASDLLVNHLEDTIKYSSMYESYVREETNSPFWLVNTNKLLKANDGIDGLKTGWTEEAGYCITITKEVNGMRLVCVVMGATTALKRNKEALRIINYGFTNYDKQIISTKGSIVELDEIVGIMPHEYEIITNEEVSRIIKKGSTPEPITSKVTLNGKVIDLLDNTEIGYLETYEGDKLISKTSLSLRKRHHVSNFLEVILIILQSIFS